MKLNSMLDARLKEIVKDEIQYIKIKNLIEIALSEAWRSGYDDAISDLS